MYDSFSSLYNFVLGMQSTDFADIDIQCFYGCFSKCTKTNNKESGNFSDKKRMIIMWPIFVSNERERERGGGDCINIEFHLPPSPLPNHGLGFWVF